MRIQVLSDRGLHHNASGFRAWTPGIYDFPDDERFKGFIDGQIERGTCRLAPEGSQTADEAAAATEEAKAELNADQPDYAAMSNKELLALIAERGLEAPRKANKETLIGILTAEAPVDKNEDAPAGDGEVSADARPVAEPGAVSSDSPADHANMPDALPRGSAV